MVVQQVITYKLRPHTRVIILHDSHTKPGIERVVNWLRWNGRKQGLLDIGYHFVIDRDGHLTEARPMALIGTHTPGHDMDSIGVCLIGGLDDSEPPRVVDNFTEDQKRTLFDLVRKLKRDYGGISLAGHDELTQGRHRRGKQAHACPSCDMTDLRQDYQQYVQSGGLLA